jgi:hypothetical protein
MGGKQSKRNPFSCEVIAEEFRDKYGEAMEIE